MANAYLGIGHGATDTYITAEDTAKFNLALQNAGSFVSNYLDNFGYTIVDNNHILIKKGVCWVQGRPVYLKADTTLTIDNGTTGYNRKDIISMRLTRDVVTAIEEANLVVIKGTPTIGTPSAPTTNSGDFNGVVNILDYSLYEVLITNLVITSATFLQVVNPTNESRLATLNNTVNAKQPLLGKGNFATGNFDTFNTAGTYNITGTTLTNQPIALPGELTVFAATAIAPIHQIFITTGTTPRIFHRIINNLWVEEYTTGNEKKGTYTTTAPASTVTERAITFGKTFAVAPHVEISIEALYVDVLRYVIKYGSITTTGFTIMLYNSAGGADNVKVHWTASNII